MSLSNPWFKDYLSECFLELILSCVYVDYKAEETFQPNVFMMHLYAYLCKKYLNFYGISFFFLLMSNRKVSKVWKINALTDNEKQILRIEFIKVFQTVNALSWFKMQSNPEIWHSKEKIPFSNSCTHNSALTLLFRWNFFHLKSGEWI